MQTFKHFISIASISLFVFSSSNLTAKGLDQEFKIWDELTISGAFKEGSKWSYLLQNTLRLRTQGKTIEDYIIRLGLGYALGEKTRVWIGCDNHTIYPENDLKKRKKRKKILSKRSRKTAYWMIQQTTILIN